MGWDGERGGVQFDARNAYKGERLNTASENAEGV
jgi:hypothetical protein